MLLASGLLLAVLLAGVGLLRLAGSERGAALLANALRGSGLAVEGLQGTLLDGRIGLLGWRGERETLQLRDIGWTLDRACLLRLALCVRRISAGSLEITLNDTGGDSPLDIPPLSLPVDIAVAEGSVRRLVLRSTSRELLRIEAIRFAGALRGSRLDVSSLTASSQGLGLGASGWVDIAGQLPLTLQATLTHEGWPALELSAQGDLRRLALKGTLGGDWPLAFEGSVEPLGEQMPLALHVRAAGALALPGEAAAYGALVDARATLEGTLHGVDARLESGTQSEWIGSNAVEALLRWSPERGIELQRARLQGDAGTLDASGRLSLDGSLGWQLTLHPQKACLPRWRERMGCRIDGSVQAEGTFAGAKPALRAALDLQGQVNALPAALSGRVTLGDARVLQLQELRLLSAGNTLQLSGSAGELLALEGTLQLRALGETLPGARGRGTGTFRIEGSREQPRVDASLELADLAWQGSTAERLALQLQGSRAAHVLRGSLRIPGIALDVDCRGKESPDTGDWSGSCSRLELGTPTGLPDWQLDRVLRLDWLAAERRLSIDPFCLRSGETTACSTARVRISPAGIDGIALRSDALPVALLPALLPPEVSASGTLALAVQAARRGTEPLQLQASLSSPLLRFDALAASEEVPIELRDTAISLRRSGESIQLVGSALTGPEGRIEMALAAAGALPASALSGRIALRDVDTGPVLRLLPGSLEAGGRLGGEVRVGGSVGAPSLSGELTIGGGRFAHEALPQAIEDFSLALRFTGADATFDGQLRTRAGTGEIDGALRWAGEDWSASLGLRADDLLLEPRRGTRIHVAPDIRVDIGPALARIGGTVRIPRADVDLEALPGNAVSVSRDTVIVGAAPAQPGIDYALAIDLLPGAHVRLRGFGVDARLGGALRLLREPDEALEGQGELKILDGRYTAYGQRLEVTEGSLLFKGALSRPALRITAVRRIEDEPVSVGVQVRGDAKAPELRVFSRPAMPESRALHYLLTGRAPAAGADNELAASSALMQLGIAGAGKVTGKVLGKLGIQDFQVDSRKVEGGTEVQLSGYLTPDIYLRYGVSTFEKVNTLRVRYRLTPRFFVEAVSGAESAVDFLYSFSR